MRVILFLLAMMLSVSAQADDGDCVIGNVRKYSAHALDSRLPEKPLAQWLKDSFPKGTNFSWEINDCGEPMGDPQTDAGRTFSQCVAVTAEVLSRDRDFVLQFQAEDPLAAPFFIMSSSDIESPIEFAWLGDIEKLLKEPLALAPITCFQDGRIARQAQDAGLSETCQRPDGTLHGSHRSWYGTGLYLMEQGLYLEGQKAGDWVECDRFESCKIEKYPLNLKRLRK